MHALGVGEGAGVRLRALDEKGVQSARWQRVSGASVGEEMRGGGSQIQDHNRPSDNEMVPSKWLCCIAFLDCKGINL